MKTIFLLIFLQCAFAGVVRAQDAEEHPLQSKIDAKIDEAESTAEIIEATRAGLKRWDTELNRVYQELRKKLGAEATKALQESQRQWLVARDSQVKFLAFFYGQFQGTVHGPAREYAIMNVTRTRALELWKLEQYLAESGE
jgi:uncharacterized protein YecT (DUF1311 family)